MSNCTYNLRDGKLYYQNMVTQIKNMLGMKHYIQVFEADTDNACATLYLDCKVERMKPIITYNPRFIAELKEISPWAVYAVFAHEVAHHHNGDLYGAYQAGLAGNRFNYRSHIQELNADYVAGWVLAWKGAPLEQTTLLYYLIDMPATNTHPATSQRVQEATRGWRDARRKMAA